MIGAHIDITERKAAEHRIGKLLEEAGQRERAFRDKQDQLIQAAKLVSLGEMATGVAHEINNPLNNISLFAGNILDGLEHGADVTAEGLTGNLKRILQQVKRAAAIVNHLRTFARASSPGHEQVAIDTIVSAAYALMEEQLRLAGIQVTMDLAPGDPQVQGNSIHLEQVFVDLFGNARDALATVPIKQLNDSHRRQAVYRSDLRARQREWDRCQRARACLRSVLYHQAGRRRHRPGTLDQLRHYQGSPEARFPWSVLPAKARPS